MASCGIHHAHCEKIGARSSFSPIYAAVNRYVIHIIERRTRNVSQDRVKSWTAVSAAAIVIPISDPN